MTQISQESFYGIGVRSRTTGSERTLEVQYLWLRPMATDPDYSIIKKSLSLSDTKKVTTLSPELLGKISEVSNPLKKFLSEILSALNTALTENSNPYHTRDIILFQLTDHSTTVESVEEGYFKLHLISHRLIIPHQTSLAGMFGVLENMAWSNYGPILVEDLPTQRLKHINSAMPLTVTHVDKFPYLVNYHVPSQVRIADGSKVRLGAYLGKGSTVMPAGYVNFNAGTMGKSMIEGRISAGVVVGEASDIGGGGSIMGTLSGGNDLVISVGSKCLIGANAGIGISLGFGCTVAAGVYITAGSKVSLYDKNRNPFDLEGSPVAEGENIVKAMELSGKDYLLFIHDTQTGQLKCFPNQKTIELNESLHKFN